MKKYLPIALICLIAQFSVFAQTDLVITEISYNPITPNNGPEYMEILNNGSTSIQMKGMYIPKVSAQAIDYTFPAFVLNPGDFVILSNDSVEFNKVWGVAAFQYTGFILNGGLNIQLLDSTNKVMDSLTYDNALPWPLTAAGEGSSIELCDPATDNSQAFNWQRSTKNTGQIYRNRKMYGSPGVINTCASKPIIHMRYRTFTVNENAGQVDLGIRLENSSGMASTVNVKAISITGDATKDITFTSPTSIGFSGTIDEVLDFSFTVVDDTIVEPDETILFILESPNNGVLSNDSVMVTIRKDANDEPVTRQMKLIGHTDLVNSGAVRMIEVMALSNISDMSIYGIGVANVAGANPGGTDGVEYNFPAIAAQKDTHYFVTNDSAGFVAFFGFAPDFVHNPGGGAPNPFTYNGDDPIELFENGRVIDIYGILTEDGTAKIWEYTDSWAKRKDGTGPDATTFVPSNWIYGGADALTGSGVNDSCQNPYPIPKPTIDTTSVDPIVSTNGKVSAYPNPTTNNITLNGFKTAQSIVLMDVLGNILETQIEVNNEAEFDLSKFNSGLYLIRLTSKEGESSVLRILKE